jgi:putative transposase
VYPYLLRDVSIDRPDVTWAADITYIRLKRGFVYLVAVMDIFSHYIISWELSTTQESDFCCEARRENSANTLPRVASNR